MGVARRDLDTTTIGKHGWKSIVLDMDTSPGDLLLVRDIADIAGVKPGTISGYRQSGRFPPPDDTSVPDRPRWQRATVEAWMAERPGRGTRTDLRQPVRLRLARVRGAALDPAGIPGGPWGVAVREAGMTPSVEMVAVVRVAAPRDVAGYLGLPVRGVVVYRCRDCYADGVIVQRQEAWYPWHIAHGSALEQPGVIDVGIFAELARIGYRPAAISEEVSTRAPLQREAKLFHIPLRTPVLVVERVTRDAAGLVLEFLRVTSAGDRVFVAYEDLPL